MNEHGRETPAYGANLKCYDDYYDKPWWWFLFRYDTQVKKKTCLRLIRQGGKTLRGQKVLEYGYGSGAVLFSFDRSCEIHGIEISDTAIRAAEGRAARRGYENFSFRHPSDEFLLDEGSVDIIIASHVLEHVPSDIELLDEIRRLLKPDGIAVILVPINEKFADPKHVRHYATESLINVVRSQGFTPQCVLENELIFHVVERFYALEYNKKWKVIGPLIVALFNIPTALLPLVVCHAIDGLFRIMGRKPKQVGIVVKRADSSSSCSGTVSATGGCLE